ncbi:MAG TPA: hypothetical protein VNK24_09360 [Elusimicrobiota bacterium]|nr:hypothetical protein [Elusimicrobiota bacterium]
MRNYFKYLGLALGVVVAFGLMALVNTISASAAGKSAAELQREQALANPYPNDLGPERLDAATLKAYPAKFSVGLAAAEKLIAKDDHTGALPADTGGYALMLVRCSTCHSAARPLNSRFVEVPGEGKPGTPAYIASAADAMKKLKAGHPEFFDAKNSGVWQVGDHIWSRYVHRMMNKPGCPVKGVEGKKIWEFLVYDGMNRKVGADSAAWKARREKLIDEFKAKYPARYATLKQEDDL